VGNETQAFALNRTANTNPINTRPLKDGTAGLLKVLAISLKISVAKVLPFSVEVIPGKRNQRVLG